MIIFGEESLRVLLQDIDRIEVPRPVCMMYYLYQHGLFRENLGGHWRTILPLPVLPAPSGLFHTSRYIKPLAVNKSGNNHFAEVWEKSQLLLGSMRKPLWQWLFVLCPLNTWQRDHRHGVWSSIWLKLFSLGILCWLSNVWKLGERCMQKATIIAYRFS